MSHIYRHSEEYIKRELAKVPEVDRPAHRLALELGAMMVGPTCGGTAHRLAMTAVGRTVGGQPVDAETASYVAGRADELALRMREIAERYLSGKY